MTGEPAGKAEKLTNWRMLYRRMAEEYGWPPSVVGQLTYYQCRMLLCPEEEITGVRKVSGPEAYAMMRSPKKKKKKLLLRMFGG